MRLLCVILLLLLPAAARQPNFLVILVDDMGWREVEFASNVEGRLQVDLALVHQVMECAGRERRFKELIERLAPDGELRGAGGRVL